MAWLGDDLASIALEKAGIFRPGRPAVIGQPDAPPALRARAEEIGALPLQAGREYQRAFAGGAAAGGSWDWQGPDGKVFHALPTPALRGRHQGDNAAAALCAIDALAERLPVAVSAMRRGLLTAVLPGRFTVIPGDPTWILDVAHNAQAARALAENLAAFPCSGRRIAVLGLLSDKEAEAVVAPLAPLIHRWCVAPAPSDRAMSTERMLAALEREAPAAEVTTYDAVDTALASAAEAAQPGDLILVFGSFVTVEAALRSSILPPV
jgi:dihydrofolate synthase/folylpolyglutamate synthase